MYNYASGDGDIRTERKQGRRPERAGRIGKLDKNELKIVEEDCNQSSIPFSQSEMCPHPSDDVPFENTQDMVAVEVTSNSLNSRHTANGAHFNAQSSAKQRHNPYAPRASDFLNHVSNFKIIESTLRGSCIVSLSASSLLLI
jgi:hypothetical protein